VCEATGGCQFKQLRHVTMKFDKHNWPKDQGIHVLFFVFFVFFVFQNKSGVVEYGSHTTPL